MSSIVIASRTGTPSWMIACIASVIGASTPIWAASCLATFAVLTPSATCRISPRISGIFLPCPSASPTRRLREASPEHVSTRSPTPESPENVCACAPSATPIRVISASPRVISATRAFEPKPSPSETPAAMAMTFLSAPPRSTPGTSSVV